LVVVFVMPVTIQPLALAVTWPKDWNSELLP
jgi:hypothetical protein